MNDSFSKSLWDEYYAKVYGYFYRRLDDKFLVEDLTAETLNDFFLSSKNRVNIPKPSPVLTLFID